MEGKMNSYSFIGEAPEKLTKVQNEILETLSKRELNVGEAQWILSQVNASLLDVSIESYRPNREAIVI
jgi:hypothetical protein